MIENKQFILENEIFPRCITRRSKDTLIRNVDLLSYD